MLRPRTGFVLNKTFNEANIRISATMTISEKNVCKIDSPKLNDE
jgi:hypothetical protein